MDTKAVMEIAKEKQKRMAHERIKKITDELFKASVDISDAVDKKSKMLAQYARDEKKSIENRFLQAGMRVKNASDFTDAILANQSDSERAPSAESIWMKKTNED